MCILKKRELHININCVGNVFCTSSVGPCVHKWAILRFSPYVPPREIFFVVAPRCNSTGLQEGTTFRRRFKNFNHGRAVVAILTSREICRALPSIV